MHPIERLRYVARSGGLDDTTLAYESAHALGDLGNDPAALVVAARRLLDAHPACAPLWWVAARVLSADDPSAAAWQAADELAGDLAIDELAGSLPGGARVIASASPSILHALRERPDLEVARPTAVQFGDPSDDAHDDTNTIAIVVLVAASAHGYLLSERDARLAERVRAAGGVVWALAETGRILPTALFDVCVRKLGDAVTREVPAYVDTFDRDDHTSSPSLVLCPIAAIDVVVGRTGPFAPSPFALRDQCPVPGELCVE